MLQQQQGFGQSYRQQPQEYGQDQRDQQEQYESYGQQQQQSSYGGQQQASYEQPQSYSQPQRQQQQTRFSQQSFNQQSNQQSSYGQQQGQSQQSFGQQQGHQQQQQQSYGQQQGQQKPYGQQRFPGQQQQFQQPPPTFSSRPSQWGSSEPSRNGAGPEGSNEMHLRVILTHDEVGFLFGFDGVLLEQLRQQTNVELILTPPPAPEHVLSMRASLDLVFKAFSLVCRKLWGFVCSQGPPRPMVVRLAVAMTQCGSIIGKAGSKVREIRELTGAMIKVSQETLPDSNERSVDISGSGEACLQCVYHICAVLQEAPPRGELLAYDPSQGYSMGGQDTRISRPVFLCGDKAYVIEGNFAIPAPPELLRQELTHTSLGLMHESLQALSKPMEDRAGQLEYMSPLNLMKAITKAQRQMQSDVAPEMISTEMLIESDKAGLVIGKQGSKVSEIRRISGAKVHVSSEEESGQNGQRVVTISGTEETILLAKFLVQSNIDMATVKTPRIPYNSNVDNQSRRGSLENSDTSISKSNNDSINVSNDSGSLQEQSNRGGFLGRGARRGFGGGRGFDRGMGRGFRGQDRWDPRR